METAARPDPPAAKPETGKVSDQRRCNLFSLQNSGPPPKCGPIWPAYRNRIIDFFCCTVQTVTMWERRKDSKKSRDATWVPFITRYSTHRLAPAKDGPTQLYTRQNAASRRDPLGTTLNPLPAANKIRKRRKKEKRDTTQRTNA